MSALYPKVAVIVYVTDPENTRRYLLRHNRPFGDYEDEWAIVFGAVEPGEDAQAAAIREAQEELGVADYRSIRELAYTTEYTGRHGPSIVHYYALEGQNIDMPIRLNEESIGYDWVTLERAEQLMHRRDEFKALTLI